MVGSWLLVLGHDGGCFIPTSSRDMEDENGIDPVGSFRALVFIADGNENGLQILHDTFERNYIESNDHDAPPHFGLT